LEEVCPYCGTPQPAFEPQPEEIFVEEEIEPEEHWLAPDPAGPWPEDESFYPASEMDPAYEDDAAFRPEALSPVDSFADEDIFAVAGAAPAGTELEYLDEAELYSEAYYEEGFIDRPEDVELAEPEVAAKPRFHRRRRLALGCLGTLICFSAFYGGIGLLAAYNGWQERSREVVLEAEDHYRRGQENLAAGSIELAIAEFERALSLNPNLLPARESLRSAQNISKNQPTPTSETRSAAAASLLVQAEEEISQENFAEALETLSQVRDLDPNYVPERVADLLFELNYNQGLALVEAQQFEPALLAFAEALAERPGSAAAQRAHDRATLYLQGLAALAEENYQEAIEALTRLYEAEPAYPAVAQKLRESHEQFAEALAEDETWCLAEAQYLAALELAPDEAGLQRGAAESGEQCAVMATRQTNAEPTPTTTTAANEVAAATPGATQPVPAPAEAIAATAVVSETKPIITVAGTILFSTYNPNENRWEILTVPATGGSPTMVVANGTMPAVSPSGNLLLYRSEAIESEGFHVYNLTNGEDKRISIFRQDILPRWGGDDNQFIFVAQEPATQRWQIQLGFSDGKGKAQILRDGRTPDLSPDNRLIAYQGTDQEGNNPGIYVVPLAGGETRRLTNHESDRVPIFSPNGAQLAYMSTQSGNWDIYTINSEGGAPRQITTYGGNDGLPVWSPDGTKLAYVSDQGGSWHIYLIAANGGTPLKVSGWDGLQRTDWLLAQISWTR
jgi:tetratricopeptide (TPR) repeat protein